MAAVSFIWNAVWSNLLAEVIWTVVVIAPLGWLLHKLHIKKISDLFRRHHEEMRKEHLQQIREIHENYSKINESQRREGA